MPKADKRGTPEDDSSPGRIEMQYPVGESHRDAIRVLNRLMTSLSWVLMAVNFHPGGGEDVIHPEGGSTQTADG